MKIDCSRRRGDRIQATATLVIWTPGRGHRVWTSHQISWFRTWGLTLQAIPFLLAARICLTKRCMHLNRAVASAFNSFSRSWGFWLCCSLAIRRSSGSCPRRTSSIPWSPSAGRWRESVLVAKKCSVAACVHRLLCSIGHLSPSI